MFEQLYILMAWYKGKCVPCGGKKTSTYNRMLKELKEALYGIRVQTKIYNT